MSKIFDYTEAEELVQDDVFLIDGETAGTRKIPASKMADFFGEQVPTDKTLTKENVAADAKTVGDEVTQLKEDITNTTSALNVDATYDIEDGYYDVNNGREQNPSAYWQEKRTTKINVSNVKNVIWKWSSEIKKTYGNINLYKWDKIGTYMGRTNIHEQSVYDYATGNVDIDDTVGFIAFNYSTRGDTVSFEVSAYGDVLTRLDELESDSGQFKCESGTFRDGDGVTPAVNVKRIRNKFPLPISKYKSLAVPSGYQVWLFELNSDKTLIRAYGSWLEGEIYFSSVVTDETKYINIAFKNVSTPDADISGEVETVANGSRLMLKESGIVSENPVACNLIHASRWTESATIKPVTLLWFTDPHRQVIPLKRIVEFKKYLQNASELDDCICTGDIVTTASDESAIASYWTNNNDVSDIMVACGNHDWYAQSASPHGKMTIEQINNIFFSNADKWGVTRQGTNPFYYKDYTGFRLIVVDPAVSDSEVDQTSWLQSVLADAITKNLSVVIASHYLVGNIVVSDNHWTDVDKRGITLNQGYDFSGVNIISCVTDFITNGGSFMCYLTGHTHYDYTGYPESHPEQLVISLASASSRRYETHLEFNDLPRYLATRTQDCFNVVTFDVGRHIIKCVRVGANANMFGQPRNSFAYNYSNHTFVNMA